MQAVTWVPSSTWVREKPEGLSFCRAPVGEGQNTTTNRNRTAGGKRRRQRRRQRRRRQRRRQRQFGCVVIPLDGGLIPFGEDSGTLRCRPPRRPGCAQPPAGTGRAESNAVTWRLCAGGQQGPVVHLGAGKARRIELLPCPCGRGANSPWSRRIGGRARRGRSPVGGANGQPPTRGNPRPGSIHWPCRGNGGPSPLTTTKAAARAAARHHKSTVPCPVTCSLATSCTR